MGIDRLLGSAVSDSERHNGCFATLRNDLRRLIKRVCAYVLYVVSLSVLVRKGSEMG